MSAPRQPVLARVKRAYVGVLQRTGRGLTRAGLFPPTAPPRDRRIRHWAYSLTRVHDSLAMAQLDVPWWTYGAIDAVDAWLAARRPAVRVFEFGSGASTIWLARRASEVHSVEHDAAFAALLAHALAGFDNVRLRVVPPVPSERPQVGSAKEGYGRLDFAAYVAAIDHVAGEFDLVVIDGRAREECLRRAIPRLAAGGLIVFDNTRRARYRRAIEWAPVVERRFRGLTPTLPYPEQTSLLTARPS